MEESLFGFMVAWITLPASTAIQGRPFNLLTRAKTGYGCRLLVHSWPYLIALSATNRFLMASLTAHSAPPDDLVYQLWGIATGFASGILAIVLCWIVGWAGGRRFPQVEVSAITAGIIFSMFSGILMLMQTPESLSDVISSKLAVEMMNGITFGMAAGVLLTVIRAKSFHGRDVWEVFWLVLLGVGVGLSLAFEGEGVVGAAFGIAWGLGVAIASTRIYYHLVHPLFIWPRLQGHWYPHHPVAWDDLCSVSFPGLDLLLVEYTEKARESGIEEIERLITNYPSQRIAPE
jgi:hypothetical protein